MKKDIAADVALEASIRAAARGPPRWIRAAFMATTVLASLCIGIVLGWGPFSSILEAEGVYEETCAPGEATPCSTQIVALSVVYTAATFAISVGGVLAGFLLDWGGPVLASAIAGSCICSGMLLLALLPSTAGSWFIVSFCAMAFGGILTCFTGFRVASVFPDSQNLLLTVVNVLFDISATLPLLALLLYDARGLSRAAIFVPYALVVGVVFGTWSYLWRRHTPSPGAGGSDAPSGAPSKQRADP